MMALNSKRYFAKNILNHSQKFYSTISVSEKLDHISANENEFKNAKPFESIPGPKSLPILGNLWRFFPGIGNYSGIGLHDLSIRLKEEFGNIVRLKGLKFQPDMINIYDPNDIEIICRNEGPYPKRDALPCVKMYRDSRKDIFETSGIFSSDGEIWHETRSNLNPIFMNPRTVKLYATPIQDIVQDFIKKIKHLATLDERGEMPENFNTEIQKFTLESVSVMVLNMKLGFLDLKKPPSPESLQFLEDICSMMEYIYQLDILPSPYKYFSTPTYKAYVKTSDRMVNFVQKCLKDSQKYKKDTKDITILEKLLQIDKKYLFGAVSDLFFAGVDTSASTIKSWMYYVSKSPEVQEKMRKEVFSALPNLDSPVTSEALEKMPYMRASIKEVLRISPIGSGSWRKLANDVVVSGYQLPKGTNVILCFFANGMNPEYFPEPKKFKPERWMREDGKRLIPTNPWLIQPFGFGVRSCIGKRLVNMEMEQLFPKIIRNFQMEWHQPPATFESRLMYQISGPLKIKMIPIES